MENVLILRADGELQALGLAEILALYNDSIKKIQELETRNKQLEDELKRLSNQAPIQKEDTKKNTKPLFPEGDLLFEDLDLDSMKLAPEETISKDELQRAWDAVYGD